MDGIRNIFDMKTNLSSSPSPSSSDCLFCRIVSGTIPANRVYEDECCIGFPDINPQAPIHLLIIPKQHIGSTAKALAEDTPLMGHLMAASAEIARKEKLDHGYRIVVNTGDDGGQTVNHLHLHLLGGRHMNWPPG
jgi:histidine triad (HIT) family protein